MKRDHSALPHGGQVIRCGRTGPDGSRKHVMEFSLKLDSNPEFTASVLVACARAVVRMNSRQIFGCKTLFDVPPADLSPIDPEEMRKHLL
jgi:diaminopimelate dehydrogenase